MNTIMYLDAISAFSQINSVSLPDSTRIVADYFNEEIKEGEFMLQRQALATCIFRWRKQTKAIVEYACRPPMAPWPVVDPEWPLEDQE